ncbi:hypothetical protein FACS1894130_11110 [Spirochaetia bacterium]|nr:hypothetical protein FACS1894130_11110 [Spirochaetia bacterium]
MDIAIQKADAKMRFVSSDDEALRIYEMREKAAWDWTSGVNHAKREQSREIARKLKVRGRPLEEIAEDTGLDVESIKKL